jgi:photosystem II stability/assembly factor-like uncharacterized protein
MMTVNPPAMSGRKIALVSLLICVPLCSALGQWTVQHTGLPDPDPNPRLHLSVVDEQVCWGVKWSGTRVVRTTDGGVTWSISVPDPSPVLRGSCIRAINGLTAWVALWDTTYATSGGIYRTTDGGQSWVRQPAFAGPGGFPDIVHFFDDSAGVCVGDPRNFGSNWEIYTSTNGGNTWNPVPASNIAPPSPGEVGFTGGYKAVGRHLWFVTSSGGVYRTSDRGAHWDVTRNVGGVFFGVDFTDTLHGLSVGSPFKRTTDGGVNWFSFAPKSFPTNIRAGFLAVAPGTRGSFVTGVSGTFAPGSAYTVDYGDTWSLIDRNPHGITRFASSQVGWSAGPGDTVYKWTGGLLSPSVAIRVDNPAIDFQNVRIGSVSDTVRVSIVNWGRNPLTVTNLSHSMSEFDITNPPLLPATVLPVDDDRLLLNIIFRPTLPGHLSLDSLVIASNDPLSPLTAIALRGRGSAPVVAPLNDVAYAILVSNGSVLLDTLELTRGRAVPLGALSPGPPPDAQGLAVRGFDRMMYGSYSTGAETRFYRISSQGGDFEFAGSVPLGGVRGLHFTPGDTLILSDTTGRVFGMQSLASLPFRIDSSGVPLYSFARSPTTGQLWGVSQFGIYKISPQSWSKTLVGTFPGVLRPSIAVGRFGSLYALFDGDLFTLDRVTGTPTLIGSTGNPNLRALVMLSSIVGSAGEEDRGIPQAFALRQNYPNPFNPTTTIEFDLPSRSHVELKVFDVLGRMVAALADEDLPAGRYSRVFSATRLASGVYLAQFRAGTFTASRKLLLLR